MEKIITDLMTEIDLSMREQGCYLETEELYELAVNELSARTKHVEVIETPWQ